MRQSYSQRILSYLTKNESETFTKQVAKRRFRNVNDIDGSVMRRARELASNKMLKRVSPGEYKITAKGKRAVSN